MEDGPDPDPGQTPATAITVGSREPPVVVDPPAPRVFPTAVDPSRLNGRAGFLRARPLRLRHGRDHRVAGPMDAMTSAEIGSIRARVVPVVESLRATTIMTRTSLATGVILRIVGESLGTIILDRIKIGAEEINVTIVGNRLGGEAGVLVTETRPEAEDVHALNLWCRLPIPPLPLFFRTSLPSLPFSILLLISNGLDHGVGFS